MRGRVSLTACMGLLSLAEVNPAGSLGVGKRLPDDVVEFRVQARHESAAEAERKAGSGTAMRDGALKEA